MLEDHMIPPLKLPTPTAIIMFANGNVAVFEDDHRLAPLQVKGWLGAWLEHVESLGYDPTGWVIELPGGKFKARVYEVQDPGIRQDHRWTWEVL